MIDIEQLLAPVSEESPAGSDLRLVTGDLTFQRIEEMRTEQAADLDVEGKGQEADWPGVVRECSSSLTTASKDLQIAAWLVEGLARTEGFAGLRDGLRLIQELVSNHWEHLYPGVDPEAGEVDLPLRAKWVSWLGSKEFRAAVGSLPISAPEAPEPLQWSRYEESEAVEEQRGGGQTRFEEMVTAGMWTGDQWKGALRAISPDRVREVFAALGECQSALRELDEICEEKFGSDEAPLLMPLRDLLDSMHEQIEPLLPAEAVAGEAAAGAEPGPGVASGPIASREEALQRLSLVADYFRRTEPHSPISLLIERAVRWGHLPFEKLLKDFVKSEEVLTSVWETLGMVPDEHQD